jgi:hypothetical protein
MIARALLVAAVLLALAAPALAQGPGIYIRASCSTLNSVVAGQTVCFDSTLNRWHGWSGISWVPISPQAIQAGAGTVASFTIDPTGRMTLPGSLVVGGGFTIGSTPPTDQGAGTMNFASASYANNLALAVASATGPNLANLRGLSASSSLSNNLRGTCTFAGAATCAVTFTNNEPDAHYYVMTGCNVNVSAKARSGFTMTATGTSSNACDWSLMR